MIEEGLQPDWLRCEYQEEPLGIDQTTLHFGWNNHVRIIIQKFFRMEIADSQDRLIFDSGIIESSYPWTDVDCSPFLTSYSRYRWRVTAGEVPERSTPSPWAWFETADLRKSLSPAVWITSLQDSWYKTSSWESGTPQEMTSQDMARHYHGIYLGTTFRLEQPVRQVIRARCYVTGVGCCSLSINGSVCSPGILSPAQTDYHKRVCYDVIDIDQALRDDNQLTILLGNGRHIALYGFGKPRAVCLVRIEYQDGSLQVIASRESWFSGFGPVRDNSIFDGEHYDANIPITLNDPAVIIDGYPLQSSTLPPVTVDRVVKPKRIGSTPDGYIIDFGQNLSGYVAICGKQPKGTTVTIEHAELLHKDGTLNPASNRAARALDSYTFCGDDEECWHPSCTYHGFRYVKFTGWEGSLDRDCIVAHFIHTETEKTGQFHCSNEDFNAVHQAILWGQQSNMMGIPTDSPQRDERHGWLGDAHLSCEEALLNFSPFRFYRTFLRDIADTQAADGSITDVAPAFWMDKPADPAWGSAFISIGYLVYYYSGDSTVLGAYYEQFARYIAFLSSHADNGIIKDLGTFGDWCAPGLVTSKKTGLDCISTLYFIHDLELMVRISNILGMRDGVSHYTQLRSFVLGKFRETFYDGTAIISQEMSPWDFPDVTSQVLALAWNILSGEDHTKLASALDTLVTRTAGNHVNTGIHGTAHLLPTLSEAGYEEKAYTIANQESYPGWIYMIRNGATTLWERWELIECEGMNSHNHIMLGSIDTWFYQYIAGISPLRPGWESIGFYPGYFQEITHAEAGAKTPYGPAAVQWIRDDGTLQVHMTIPSGVRGELYPPAGYTIDSSLKPLDRGTFRSRSAHPGYVLDPGTYDILLREVTP